MAKEFLIIKDNDERLIDESRWEFYQRQGYRKSADVAAEIEAAKKQGAGEDAPKTKKELLAEAKELGIDVPNKATNAQIEEMIAAKKAENEAAGDGSQNDSNEQ